MKSNKRSSPVPFGSQQKKVKAATTEQASAKTPQAHARSIWIHMYTREEGGERGIADTEIIHI